MATIFTEIGVFCVALIASVYFQIHSESEKSKDCKLFSRLLLAAIAIFVVDTLGWIIDGAPICGQVWITTVVDGLDLIFTTVVCWCWVQYALYIAVGEQQTDRKWYQNFTTWLLILQIVLVSFSQIFGFYYSVDAAGVYHREVGYVGHTLISLTMLSYSSFVCLTTAHKEHNPKRKKESLFVALIIIIPVLGNIFQFFVYGYPTVWLCMGFMIFTVYVHIQNQRTNAERELHNAELEKALEEAKQANEAKTQFLAKMSHDMRTPMNTIVNLTKMVEDELDDRAAAMADLRHIETSNEFLLGLIEDILDMSRIESGKLVLHPERYRCVDFLDYLHCSFDELARKKNIELTIAPEPEPVTIMIDRVRFNQVCFHLLSNALKYTKPGGHVSLMINHGILKDGILPCEIIVSDDGIGMSKAFQTHLFSAFEQEGRCYHTVEGVGLGLSIVKNILDAMGATITVQSEENIGTTYTIHLDMILAKDEPQAQYVEKIKIDGLAGKHILLVEDHPMNQMIAKRLLTKVGILVSVAENGQEALDLFSSDETHFDAILMDLRMPVMDGLTAARELRKLNQADAKTIPIIAMTANAYRVDVQKCFDAGMDGHLGKPIDPQKLYEALALRIGGTK